MRVDRERYPITTTTVWPPPVPRPPNARPSNRAPAPTQNRFNRTTHQSNATTITPTSNLNTAPTTICEPYRYRPPSTPVTTHSLCFNRPKRAPANHIHSSGTSPSIPPVALPPTSVQQPHRLSKLARIAYRPPPPVPSRPPSSNLYGVWSPVIKTARMIRTWRENQPATDSTFISASAASSRATGIRRNPQPLADCNHWY